MNLPELTVPRVSEDWNQGVDLAAWQWQGATQLPPLLLADGSGPARQQTRTQVCYNSQALFVRFDCEDRDIWGTYMNRDEAIYDEEVVEVFIGPGDTTPVDYYELEVSPNGTLLDVFVHNPASDRIHIKLDFGWDCPGLRWAAGREDAQNHWWAVLALPWPAIGAPGALPNRWRANFYRIERPRDADPEFSCWSPTLTEPADFHKPGRFGYLTLG